MMRATVSWASTVCSVDMTRCPVSAAVIAALTVSRSRISPTMITSGSWRIAPRIAVAKSSVSTCTSRWLIMPSLSKWTISIGSSIVTMLTSRWLLTWSIMPARVVDLPEPVGPVTRTRPRGSVANAETTAGRPRPSSGSAPMATRRNTMPAEPRCRNALTRNRPSPSIA